MNTYTKDKYGKDIIIDETGYQVMMEWEKPYMEALVSNLNPSGDVLEIGFGLGYSANAIQSHNIKTHTIIEQDKETIEKLKDWASKQKHEVKIVEGTWQDKMNELGKFDSIFFDDAPIEKYPDPELIRVYDFYYRLLDKHAKKNAKFTLYQDFPVYWLCNPYIEYKCKSFDIKIADNCKYVRSDINKKGKNLFLPLISFPFGVVKDLRKLALGTSLKVYELKRNI